MQSPPPIDETLDRLGAPAELVEWAGRQEGPEAAFAECRRADWIVWIAAAAGFPMSAVLLAARSAVLRALDAEPVVREALGSAVASLLPGATADVCAQATRDAARAAGGHHGTYRSAPAASFRAAAEATKSLASAGEALAAVEARFEFVRAQAAHAAAAGIGAGPSIMFHRREELRLAPDIAPGDPFHEELAFATASLAAAVVEAAEALADAPAEEPEVHSALETLAEEVRRVAASDGKAAKEEQPGARPDEPGQGAPRPAPEAPPRSRDLLRRLARLDEETLLGLGRGARRRRRKRRIELRRRLDEASADDGVALAREGRRALESGELGAATRLLRRAIALVGDGPFDDPEERTARAAAPLCLAELEEADGELGAAVARHEEAAALLSGCVEDRQAPVELVSLAVHALLQRTRLSITLGDEDPKVLRASLVGAAKKLQSRAKSSSHAAALLTDVARLHRGIAEVSATLGRLGRAEIALFRSLEILHDLSELHPESAEVQSERATTALTLGLLALGRQRYGHAEDHLAMAEQLLRPMTRGGGAELAGETASLCRVLAERGDVATSEGELGEAWEAFDEAARLRLDLVELQPRRMDHWTALCRALNVLAELAIERRRPRRAKVLAERCLDLLHSLERAAPMGPAIAAERFLALELLAEIEERAGRDRVARAYDARAHAIERDFPHMAAAIRNRPAMGERADKSAGGAFLAFDRFFEKLRIF